MRQSRLVKRIEKLDSRQKELFTKFVNSPYFNQHNKTIALLKLILSGLKKKSASALDRKKIYAKLFPNEKYEEQHLHNVMSYLMRLFHRFLAYQKLEDQQFEEPLATLEQAYEDNRLDVFTNRSKLFQKSLESHSTLDADYYFARFRYHHLLRDYKIHHVNRADQKSGQQLIHALDDFYVLEKLRHSCLLKAHEMIVNTSYDFTFLEEIMNYVSTNWNKYQSSPTIAAYYTVLKMLDNSDELTYYQQLKKLLLDHTKSYSYQNLNELYDFASNYCILKVNRGNVEFQKELFDIYKQSIKNETMLRNGKIDGWDYKNISTLGCHLGEFSWTYSFIESHKDKLLESHQSNAYNYSLANYYLHIKDYDKASRLLLQVQFTEVQYHLGGNLLLMRSYYELEDYEALFSLLESMRIYIMRSKKMTVKEKRGYKNMLRFAKKLVNLQSNRIAFKTNDLKAMLKKLEDDINQNENVYAKRWLLQKIEQFI